MRWCLLLLFLSLPAKSQDWEQSVVKIRSYSQKPDYDAPWRRESLETKDFLGTVVAGRHVLVSALAVEFAQMLEMTRFGEARKWPMVVAYVDYAANLALLKPTDPEGLNGLKPVSLGRDIKQGTTAQLFSGRRANKIITIPVQLSEVEVRNGGTANYALVHYNFEVSQSSGLGWAEPVVKDGQLVAITVGQATNTVFALPVKVIRHFVEDVASGAYRGFGRLGLVYDELESQDLRGYLAAGTTQNGVLITDVSGNSPFAGKVEVNDILLKVDGAVISEQGYVQHLTWGKVRFSDKVTDFFAGDAVTLTVVRKGERLDVSGILKRFEPGADFIPDTRRLQEPFVVFGGAVFQELTEGFLKEWGQKWIENAPETLVFLWQYRNNPPADGSKKLIILNQVLLDKHNKGYETFRNLVLVKANGKEIHSLADLRSALDQPVMVGGVALAHFEFSHFGGSMVLAYDGLDEVQKRITERYNIHEAEAFYLRAAQP